MNRVQLSASLLTVILMPLAAYAADEPGLLVRLYDVGEEMHALPDLPEGQFRL